MGNHKRVTKEAGTVMPSKIIYNKIISTTENPFHFFERLTGRADYKLRIGDYRAVADIDSGNGTIKVTVIGHRKNIYKNLA